MKKKNLSQIVAGTIIGGGLLLTAACPSHTGYSNPELTFRHSAQEQQLNREEQEKMIKEGTRAKYKLKIERLYGTVVEPDTDDNPDLRFVIETCLTADAYKQDRTLGKLPDDIPKYKVLVERKFDPKCDKQIEAIREDINSNPYRVEIVADPDYEDGITGKKIEGKYDLKVTPKEVYIFYMDSKPGDNRPDKVRKIK